ncbi:MAG TPA: glycoside hydrolase family 57 protein [Nitrososphaerales archaeon]|nr:glycoside hydrolase family 57 protein [Nitrososphaerales archaeon]
MNGSARAAEVIILVLLGAILLPLAPSTVGSAPVIRMSVTTDRYTYPLTGSLVVTVTVTNLEAQALAGLSINSTIYDSANDAVMALPPITDREVGALSTANFSVSATYSLADANYVIVSDATVGGAIVGSASVPLVVLNTEGRAPLTLAIVWHMHQPIYLNLQGQFEQPWVQIHSGSDFVYNGTWYGAYYWQVLMLEDHPSLRVTFNLQPSLLYQWNASLKDFQYNGTFPAAGASLAYDLSAINATVDGYRALAASGQAEILTSPFYHPLSAILVQFGWGSDLLAQIELGKNYTDSYMGVNATGMWTPEMGFTMGMVPIIQEAGMQYTVLDQEYHFDGSEGPGSNSSVYQPFELEGANGSHIIVFFRDTQISTDLSNVWNTIPNPKVAASDFIAAVANVYRSSPGGVLTLASDGENPIVADGLVSALDYNAIYDAIASQSWLQTSTLGSIVASHPVTAKLTYVPDGSWSGGFGLWIGAPQKTAIWEAIMKARATLVNLTAQYGASNPEIKKLWNYLYIAEGSDWEWQTPTGPTWFAMQGYRYAAAASNYQAPPAPPSKPLVYWWAAGGAILVAAAAVTLVLWRRKKP